MLSPEIRIFLAGAMLSQSAAKHAIWPGLAAIQNRYSYQYQIALANRSVCREHAT
jgi:hypothetical protein